MDRSIFFKLYKCRTANTSAIWQHAAHATDQLTWTPSCLTGAIQKSLSLNEKYWRIFWKKFRRMDQHAEKDDRKSNRTRKKNKRGGSKVESNDSPEIPDGGRHQTFSASLRGFWVIKKKGGGEWLDISNLWFKVALTQLLGKFYVLHRYFLSCLTKSHVNPLCPGLAGGFTGNCLSSLKPGRF